MKQFLGFLLAGLMISVIMTQGYIIKTHRTIMDRLDYAEEFDNKFAERLIVLEAAVEGNARNTLLVTKYLVENKDD
jgi:hypothetical protein